MDLSAIDQLFSAKNKEDIEHHAKKLAAELGFNSYLYGVVRQISPERQEQFISTNYAEEWLERYQANQYAKLDSAFLHCLKHTQPYFWKINGHAGEGQKVFDEASSFGLKHGISIPIHDPKGLHGVFSLATDNVDAIQGFSLGNALLLTNAIHASFSEHIVPDVMPDLKIRLTNRELECLQWTAAGKTAWEISQILQLSERTVIFHLTNSIQKLNAQNKHQAIAKAAMMGLLS